MIAPASMHSTASSTSASTVLTAVRATFNIETKTGEFHFFNTVFYVDIDDFNLLSKDIYGFTYYESDEYPYYMDTNSKKRTLIECLYIYSPIHHKYVFKNGNSKDLRRNNVEVYHLKHDDIIKEYPNAEYLGGHYLKNGKNAFLIQNPIWKLKEDDQIYYLMYAYPDKLSILCEEGMQKIRDFEKEKNNGKRITWSCTNGFHLAGAIYHDRIYAMHQIITGLYGQGRGTGGLSVDHIDRNPLNNCMSNLRFADRKMQEQNTTGIADGTKRNRNYNARPLPEGITQEMMRKHMVYNVNTYNKEKDSKREYFSIENHPMLDKTWESSKSGKVSIMEKYEETIKVLDDLANGILPENKTRELPPHMMIVKTRGYNSLVFDWKKRNGVRMNAKMKLPDGEYDLDEQINKMRAIIEAKYGEKSYE